MPDNLYQLAEILLSDAKEAFHFGSVNKEPIASSAKQFLFINQEIYRLIESLNEGEKKFKFFTPKDKVFYRNKTKGMYDKYKAQKDYSSLFELLSSIYSYEKLKDEFKNKYDTKWEENWLDYTTPVFALDELQKIQKDVFEEKNKDSQKKFKLYQKICKDGVPDHPGMRKLYFENVIFEILLSTSFGVGNCEPMAEFALLTALEKSADFSYEINYIRFPEHNDYDELNAITLGNWPDKGCLIVAPWLEEIGEKGLIEWEGSLETTKELSHYPNYKKIVGFKPGEEMGKFRENLKCIKFSEQAKANQCRKTEIEKLADDYKQAFVTFFLTQKKRIAILLLLPDVTIVDPAFRINNQARSS